MNKLLFTLTLTLIGLTSLAAANEPRPGAESRPGDDMQPQQQLLSKIRTLESHSHMERIMILQRAEGCIQTAKSLREFHGCEQKERAEREKLRGELQPKQEALREQAQQLRNSQQAALQAKP